MRQKSGQDAHFPEQETYDGVHWKAINMGSNEENANQDQQGDTKTAKFRTPSYNTRSGKDVSQWSLVCGHGEGKLLGKQFGLKV